MSVHYSLPPFTFFARDTIEPRRDLRTVQDVLEWQYHLRMMDTFWRVTHPYREAQKRVANARLAELLAEG